MVMARKKVLFLSSWYPNKLDSHLGNFVQRHAEAVQLLNDVEVLYAIGNPEQKELFVVEDEYINGVRTVIVYYRKTFFPPFNFLRRKRAYRYGFKRMTKPDIVHGNILQTHVLFARELKEKYGIPYIVTEHWSGLLKANYPSVSSAQKRVVKLISDKADYLVPVSHALKNDMISHGIGKQYAVVGNVVDTSLFTLKKERNAQPFQFLHVSNLVELKNPDKIIRAAVQVRKTHSNFELWIGGDGETEPLKALVQSLNASDYIHLFGKQSLADVADLMRKSDCFILFSDYENLPCVLLESMSTGTPVIATNVGGVKEIVHSDTGILIAKKEDELVAAMEKMLTQHDEMFASETMHQYVEQQFSYLAVSKQFDAIYSKVLSR